MDANEANRANQIERQYGSKGVHANSLHPGGIQSGLQTHLPQEQQKAWTENKAILNYMKSPAQGAATSVYAALSRDLEGKGGHYLEDCDVAPAKSSFKGAAMDGGMTPGYADHAFNPEGEQRLWKD